MGNRLRSTKYARTSYSPFALSLECLVLKQLPLRLLALLCTYLVYTHTPNRTRRRCCPKRTIINTTESSALSMSTITKVTRQ
ncbi:hypothetical protein BU24DRAFT_94016 [Aaosphaeria arxii CBS 175.79]|uniref:Uncharacterized protein n=1 Tax=Aaosphaeria arxii CBS 175.79 TaxID=1450172 RepID=A0A6A5X6S6_9PLEO|nr:uncharacterized protein BU24DRAFT_94016 [Aaosphaeria arxii CBS 175.79]KAF2008601.1 hypothetical protein BU24DRAFT_94016 [Aaosphaeria arxii CBS 175.79]